MVIHFNTICYNIYPSLYSSLKSITNLLGLHFILLSNTKPLHLLVVLLAAVVVPDRVSPGAIGHQEKKT